ncbi:MAG: DUF2384 domain-containing protein [Candidatus Solibacter usitatus]|nr:DUF2384 domain-containing protein [Candidatus Solibacter usitatus]
MALPTDFEPMAPESLHDRMAGKLGVGGFRTSHELVAVVERLLPATAIMSLVSSGLTDTEVYQLIIPRRTLSHRIARKQRLSAEESDKAVRVARITAMAEEAFIDSEKSWRWLRKPKRIFGGRKPIDMLATEAGARLVEEMLVQFHYGMTA